MWHDFWTKNQKGILFAAGLIFFLTACLIVAGFPSPARQAKTQAKNTHTQNTEPQAAETHTAELNAHELSSPTLSVHEQESDLVLYITGAVRRPGVYELPPGSRLLQLVEAAGGMHTSADPTAVNLASVLEDGLHVHVPEKGEEPLGVSSPRSPARGRSKPVDVNRASAEELTALKGIGPVLARNIVDYRLKNGRFHSVDDLLHVRGIGRKKLEQFRDSVTVGP